MKTWYYSDSQRNRLGPVEADDLAQLHAGGQLAPDVLVWREGMPEWKPWREVMSEVLGAGAAAVGMPAAPPKASFAVAREDGGGGNPYEIVERVAPAASPYAAPTAAIAGGYSQVVHDGDVVYAGFWKRVAAYFIDLFILVFGSAIIGGVLGGVFAIGGGRGGALNGLIQVITSIGGIAYFVGFHSSSLQATPGKLAIGIKVARSDGERIGAGRAIGRYFATILSSLIILIGYAMAGFTERKQALHDMVCDTVVVDKWAFTAHPDRQRPELGAVTIIVLVLGVIGMVVLVAALSAVVAALGNLH